VTANLIDNPTLNYLGLLIPILPLVGYLGQWLIRKVFTERSYRLDWKPYSAGFIHLHIGPSLISLESMMRFALTCFIGSPFGQLDISFGFWFDPLTDDHVVGGDKG
jgi:hypothetical protein